MFAWKLLDMVNLKRALMQMQEHKITDELLIYCAWYIGACIPIPQLNRNLQGGI